MSQKLMERKKEIREQSKEIGESLSKAAKDPKVRQEAEELHELLSNIPQKELIRKFSI